MTTWKDEALALLEQTLSGLFPKEENRLDWKQDFSSKEDRPHCHLSAFANLAGGGYLVFGIKDSDTTVLGLTTEAYKRISQKIASAAREGVQPAVQIDSAFLKFRGKDVLVVKIFESPEKPVHLKGRSIEDSYIRSGGETHKMSQDEIRAAIISSKRVKFEQLEAIPDVKAEDLRKYLDIDSFLALVSSVTGIRHPELEMLKKANLVVDAKRAGSFSITNLGMLVCAKDFSLFERGDLAVRVIKYKDTSKLNAISEKKFSAGYATSFVEILSYIQSLLPFSEIIKEALRETVLIYPPVAIRELFANAIVHQDLTRRTGNILVEIFSDRLVITNPGILLPSIHIDQLINVHPLSRNEIFAGEMKVLGLCEERGSGIDRVFDSIEIYGLPPMDFYQGESYFEAKILAPKSFKEMSIEERVRACYQHCCLLFVSNKKMTNSTLRRRFNFKSDDNVIANRVIKASLAAKKIKIGDPDSKARKYTFYVPYWAD